MCKSKTVKHSWKRGEWTIHTRTCDTRGTGRAMRNKRSRMLRFAMHWNIKILYFALRFHQGRLEFNPTKPCLNHITFHPKTEVYVIVECTITFGENLLCRLDWGKQGRGENYFSQPSHNALDTFVQAFCQLLSRPLFTHAACRSQYFALMSSLCLPNPLAAIYTWFLTYGCLTWGFFVCLFVLFYFWFGCFLFIYFQFFIFLMLGDLKHSSGLLGHTHKLINWLIDRLIN